LPNLASSIFASTCSSLEAVNFHSSKFLKFAGLYILKNRVNIFPGMIAKNLPNQMHMISHDDKA